MLTKNDFSQIQKIVHDETNKIVQKELKPVKRDIKKIKKDIDIIVTTFDRDYVFLRRRVDRIENHLQLPPYPSA